MKKMVLDLRGMQTTGEIHRYLKREMDFPEYYGENLDALYDELSSVCEDIFLVLLQEEADELGVYHEKFERVFADAENGNPRLHVVSLLL